MAAHFLSGTGGSANWLPLIIPLAAIALVLYAIDMVIKLVKRKKLRKAHPASDTDFNDHIDDHHSLT